MGYEINLDTKIKINIENCNLKLITIQFLFALNLIFQEYVTQILSHYFEHYYQSGEILKRLQIKDLKRKSTSNLTKFKTIFGDIWVPQIQIRAIDFEGKIFQMSITRKLLGVSPMFQIPDFMKEIMGWIGSMCSYRVGFQIVNVLTNFKCSLMSLWNSVQFSAKRIKLILSKTGTNQFESDGTGIPTKGTGKRGSELKKVFQRTKEGKLQLVGLAIGKYKDLKNWKLALVDSLKSGLKQFKKVVLISDGDNSIINTAKKISKKIKIQKDKWHVFYQMKYYLWQDKVTKDKKDKTISFFYKITMLSKLTIEKRTKRIARFIFLLENVGYKHTATFLKSAMNGFYTHETEKNANVYTSQTERSMRTTNQRINIGLWSESGALNVSKIRLSHYYNGINPLNWK